MHRGRVVRVDNAGMAFVEATRDTPYVFTFDQIEGYKGQKPSQIGLKEGVIVRFTVHDGLIKTVVISSEPEAAR